MVGKGHHGQDWGPESSTNDGHPGIVQLKESFFGSLAAVIAIKKKPSGILQLHAPCTYSRPDNLG